MNSILFIYLVSFENTPIKVGDMDFYLKLRKNKHFLADRRIYISNLRGYKMETMGNIPFNSLCRFIVSDNLNFKVRKESEFILLTIGDYK